jgi:formate C-acetyltransferase
MHDRYAYERLEMALHDYPVHRFLATGIAGLSVAADSLSAIKHAQVKVLRNETGLAIDYAVDGDYPAFGNNDGRADDIAVFLVRTFMEKIRRQAAYRGAEPTLSVLTITSNVVYGRHTGNTPDGRRAGEPFAPGANPMNGRDRHGVVAAALSVAKLANLVGVLDGCIDAGGFHMNVNVLDRATLLHAMEHPELHPHLTIRVSGYAVNFVRLTPEQQQDVLSRTFHGAL